MKEYPTIPYWNNGHFGESCYAFEKLDGSNLRAGYSHKRGFYKFGSKTQMIDESDPIFGKGISLFLLKYADTLDFIFKKHYRNVKQITVFFEFFGEKSFAGWHDANDDHDVKIFDVFLEDRNTFIPPREFVLTFPAWFLPKIYYKGAYNKNLIHQVKEDTDLAEGVVIKGGKRNVWMVKAKTNKWFDRLRSLKGEIELLKEVNGDTTILETS